MRAITALFLILAAARLHGQDRYFPGEQISLPPFSLTVADLKYSQGTKFNRPPDGFLFLVLNVRIVNPTADRARFRWREWFTVTSGQSEYVIDTVRNSPAQVARTINAGEEKLVPLWFVVPQLTYETGAFAQVACQEHRYTIDLRYADAYDGHLAAGLAWTDKKEYARALAEFRLAAGHVEKQEIQRYNYITYRIGEAYGKLFLFEEALAAFTEIVNLGQETAYYKESKGNYDLLKYKLESEKKNDRAVRLAEAGYNCGFQIGDEEKALRIFERLRSECAGIKVGAFTADQVAVIYSVMIHLGRQRYVPARALCQEALSDQALCKNAEFKKIIEQQLQECQGQGGQPER